MNQWRVFFYISNLKEAFNVSRRMEETNMNDQQNPQQRNDRNEYDVILNCIAKQLNKHDKFKSYASAEIYEYTKKNQTNVLHIKGIKHEQG